MWSKNAEKRRVRLSGLEWARACWTRSGVGLRWWAWAWTFERISEKDVVCTTRWYSSEIVGVASAKRMVS